MVAPPPSPGGAVQKPTYPRPASIGSPLKNRWGVGTLTSKPGEVYVGSIAGTGNKNVALSVFDTPGIFASLSPAAQAKLYRDATSVYGHDKVPTINMDSFTSQTAYNAYAVQQSTGLLIDPLNYWDYYRQSGGYGMDVQNRAAAGGAGGGGGGPVTSTSITKSVDLSNPTSARGLVDSALRQYLGRRASSEEYAAFRQALNAAERKSPNVTKAVSTTSRTGGGSATSAQTMSRGGIDRGRFAEEWALKQEGSAEYAAATTVFDTFMKMLGE